MIVLLACSEPTPCELAAETPAAAEVGTGSTVWTDLADGDSLGFVRGPQGGLHVYGSVRTRGLVFPATDSLSDPDNPMVSFELLADGAPIGGYDGLRRVFGEVGEGWDGFVGDLVVLYENDMTRVEGVDAVLRVDVTDQCGTEVADERSVRLTEAT